MPSEPCDLPDVNLWLALVDQYHGRHSRAVRYWEQEAAPRVAFCRLTMLGLLRLGTQARVMRGEPFSSPEIWRAYRAFRELQEVVFVEEPRDVEARMAVWSDREDFPQTAWSDCYLAALAAGGDYRLVTFDRDFKRFSGLNLLLLEP